MRKEKLEELKRYIEELKTIKVLDSDSKEKGFLSIKRHQFLLNNGKIIPREEILKNNKIGSASIILPITEDEEVLLTVQPRVFTQSTVGVELPAGYIEAGEDSIDSGLRELLEETGYAPERVQKIFSFYQEQGCSRAMNSSYIAFGCKKVKEQSLDKDEYIKIFKCEYEEMLELMDMGYICDANSLITIEKSKEYIKRR